MFKPNQPNNYLPGVVRQRVYNAIIINESIIKRNCLKKKTIIKWKTWILGLYKTSRVKSLLTRVQGVETQPFFQSQKIKSGIRKQNC